MKEEGRPGPALYFLAALLAYAAMSLFQHIAAIPAEADVRQELQPWPDLLQDLKHRLVCEALFPEEVLKNADRYARWREYHRVPLRALDRPSAMRTRLEISVEQVKEQLSRGPPAEREARRRYCAVDPFDVPSRPVDRAMEVLRNYQVCEEAVPGFHREHEALLKDWKRRNEAGVDRITCCRQGRRSGKDYRRQVNTFRERELWRLDHAGQEVFEEQAAFCRSTVARWLRSGV